MLVRLTVLVSTAVFLIAGAPALAIEKTTIGNAKTVVRTVTGSFEGDLRQLTLRDDVYHNELIETGKMSATELIFLDETRLTIGPNARMTLDRFVFDPDPKKAAFVMTATKGVFRFVTGKLPKQSYRIHTPAATIGIRGTIFTIVALPLASFARDGRIAVNITVEEGEAEVTNCLGARVVLNRPGMSTTISGAAGGSCSAPTRPGVQPARYSIHVERLGFPSRTPKDPTGR